MRPFVNPNQEYKSSKNNSEINLNQVQTQQVIGVLSWQAQLQMNLNSMQNLNFYVNVRETPKKLAHLVPSPLSPGCYKRNKETHHQIRAVTTTRATAHEMCNL
jgi:hypothetical protein